VLKHAKSSRILTKSHNVLK